MGKEERGERREEREYQHKGLWYCQNNLFTCQLIYPSTYLLVKSFTCQLIYLTERGMCLFAHPSFCYYTFSCGRNWLTALQNYWLNSCLLST